MSVSSRTERTVTLPDGTVQPLRSGDGTVPCGVCGTGCWDHIYRPNIGWRCSCCLEKFGKEEMPDFAPEEIHEFFDEFIVRIFRNLCTYPGGPILPQDFEILEDRPGYGRHVCSGDCPSPCYRSCDDSDRIVTVRYGAWQAVYAELDGRLICWAN